MELVQSGILCSRESKYSTLFYSLDQPCPMEEMTTKGQKRIEKFKDVMNWEDCAEKCHENEKCKAWTYRPTMMNQKRPKLCIIMSEYRKFKQESVIVTARCRGHLRSRN